MVDESQEVRDDTLFFDSIDRADCHRRAGHLEWLR
jgi:hypothetical protein